MANVLFLTRKIGPAEGAVYTDLLKNGHVITTYMVGGQWVPPRKGVPLWMKGHRSRVSPMARNWFARNLKSKNIDFAISSGLEASAFAASNFEGRIYPLLWRGDLDFSDRPSTLSDAFRDVLRISDRLLLEDTWEMTKAAAKRSFVPHLRMPYPATDEQTYLSSSSGKVALIYPRAHKMTAEELLEAAKVSLEPNNQVELVEIDALYDARDLAANRDLYEVLAERLQDYSFAIIIGTGPHHSTIVRALSHQPNRIVVEQTIGMTELSDDLGLPHRARGLRCVQLMKEIINSHTSEAIPMQTLAHEGTDDFVKTLIGLWQETYDPCYEDLPAVHTDGPLNIFFSVGALEDRVNGARPQRIRNMHGSFRQMNALDIFGLSAPHFNRRIQLARKLLNEGRSAGIFYGENSTSPMSADRSSSLAEFLDEFSFRGGRSMWFVRDLHWLGAFEVNPWTEERSRQLVADGLHELRQVGDRVDLLAAPGDAAGIGFNELLLTSGEEARDWIPLPPAVEPQNVVDESVFEDREGITVLYTGGVSSIYSMNTYLSALRDIDESVYIDFVVREAEIPPLQEELDRLGLLNSGRTRILHTTMDRYRSRTSRTLGMILMESEYAKFSFPYKTLTMVERGYPIICFSDMGIADFVLSNELGVVVERSADSISDGINKLISSGTSGISAVRRTETWDRRVEYVREMLTITQ